MAKYKFTVEGTSVEGNIWKTNGEIDNEKEHALFQEIVRNVLDNTLIDLIGGNAVYIHPGKGCNGPHKIIKLLIEKVEGE